MDKRTSIEGCAVGDNRITMFDDRGGCEERGDPDEDFWNGAPKVQSAHCVCDGDPRVIGNARDGPNTRTRGAPVR